MNIQNLLTELCRLDREWERNCFSPDLVNQKEWTEGVWYGVRMILKRVQWNVHRRRRVAGIQQEGQVHILRSRGPIEKK